MKDLTNVPWNRFPLDADPKDKVSKNFRFYELTKSDTDDRHNVDNSIKREKVVHHAIYLCRHVLQPVRDKFGRLSPNSVFRSQALERALKRKPKTWTSKSQHTKGQACDIEVVGKTTIALAKWVSENLEFDQLICECYNSAKGPNSGWVHVSVVPASVRPNRREILSYVMDPGKGKYVYVRGLQEDPS